MAFSCKMRSAPPLVLAFARMQYHVITLFPEFIRSLEQYSVIGRAIGEGKVQLIPHDLRAFGLGKYRQVDDSPFGGGAGSIVGSALGVLLFAVILNGFVLLNLSIHWQNVSSDVS